MYIPNKNQRMRKKTTEQFINDAREIYGNEYDYSKTIYEKDSIKVCIACKKHGDFYKTPSNHLHKSHPQGCPYCVREKLSKMNRSDFDDVIRRCNIKHNGKYNYSKAEYVNIDTEITIICPIHGEFTQSSYLHLKGCGCPKCKSSHLETEIRDLLLENNIEFEEQKRFEWLGLKTLDFYLPEHNIAIECQGIQHFKPIEFFGGIKSFMAEQERDKQKNQLCFNHGVQLLYYTNFKYPLPYFSELYLDKYKLLKTIIK